MLGLTGVEREKLLAVAAALVSVAIWANFLVTTGGAAKGGLGVVELGVIRAVTCAVVLTPVVMRIGLWPKGLEVWRFLVMVIGAGLGFMFLMPFGFTMAPASDSGVFGPGALPLWVAALSWMALGERIGKFRLFGFFLIAAGVFAVGGYDAMTTAGDGAWRGYLCFSGASLLFACYAIAQRGSGLTALEATALVSVWCVPVAVITVIGFGFDASGASTGLIAWTAFAQLGSGVVAVVTYTYAIIRLGPSRGSAFIALTPAIVALASDIVLGVSATPFAWIGVAVVSSGVLIASGIFERRRAPPRPSDLGPGTPVA